MSTAPGTAASAGPGRDGQTGTSRPMSRRSASTAAVRSGVSGERTAGRTGTDSPAAAPGAVLKGYYSGGTLADEAMLLAAPVLGDVRSNTPLRPELDLALDPAATDLSARGHVVVDFGDDALTVGRAHPMIDPTLRLEAIGRLAASGEPAVLLLDVVLGYGADADPAAALVPALAAARARTTLPVVIALIGTEADPQGWSRQADALAEAGAAVFASNAAATRYALDLLGAAR